MQLWYLEVAVAAVLTVVFPLSALLLFKNQHVEHHPVRVYVGAFLQGLIVGALVGFVILPLRLAFFSLGPALPTDPTQHAGHFSSLSLLPAFLMLVIVRQGLLARAPLLGPYLRAYRRASLKWQIDRSNKALSRLEALDDRAGRQRQRAA